MKVLHEKKKAMNLVFCMCLYLVIILIRENALSHASRLRLLKFTDLAYETLLHSKYFPISH